MCGYELEIRGIPEKYKKELNKIIWNFIWDGKVNQVDRKVCCLDVKKGGMGMVNLDSWIESKYIKSLYSILHKPLSSWNAIGKFWLKKCDKKFEDELFLCKCSDLSGLEIKKTYHIITKALYNRGQN